MNIAVILAGGLGLRIDAKIPKQLLLINEKPILIYTLETFLDCKDIDKIILVCHKNTIEQTKVYLKQMNKLKKPLELIEGGLTRNDSIFNAYNYLKNQNSIDDSDIIVTHDAARIFVSNNLISMGIKTLKHNKINVPILNSTNSLLKINHKGQYVMIKRDQVFEIQTPQVLTFKTLKALFESKYYKKGKNPDWELCWLASKNKIEINSFQGELENFKITFKKDLKNAKSIIRQNKKAPL